MTLTAEQLEDRRNAITASDPAALLGVHPFRSALDVWLDKTGQSPPESISPHMLLRRKWGHLHETSLRADYIERRGYQVTQPGTLIAADNPRHAATPDGLVSTVRGAPPERVLECKSHTSHLSHLYGPEGTDEVPTHEILQCQWLMRVTGLARTDLVVLLDGVPRDYAIDRAPAIIEGLIEVADRFWQDHVVAGVPPPPDGSDASRETLARLFPAETLAMHAVGGDEDILTAVHDLKEALATEADASRAAELARQAVKVIIGDSAGIEWGPTPHDRITWKKAKDSVKPDWEKAARHYATSVQLLASAPEIEMLLLIAQSLPAAVLEAGNKTLRLGDVEKRLVALREAIAHELDSAALDNLKTKAGGRRFLVPRSWGGGDE